MSAVNSASLQADAVQARLYNYILLGVDAPADFMPCPGGYAQLIPQATNLQAVLGAGRSAIVAGGQDVLVFYRHGANMMPTAG